MSRDDVADAQPTIDRIGAALDRITQAGYWKVAEALAGHTRERRGALQRVDTSQIAGHGRFTGERVARDLMELADAVEQLADTLEGRAKVRVTPVVELEAGPS